MIDEIFKVQLRDSNGDLPIKLFPSVQFPPLFPQWLFSLSKPYRNMCFYEDES